MEKLKYFTRSEVHHILKFTKTERDRLLLNLLWQEGNEC